MAENIDLNEIKLQHKMWLETADGEGILGDGKWQILRAVDQEGSLTAACQKLGLTYRRTWGDLKKIESNWASPCSTKAGAAKREACRSCRHRGRLW